MRWNRFLATFTGSKQEWSKMITSTANKKVKQIVQWQTKAKERKKDGVFLAEGRKMFEEAPPSLVCEVYLSEEFFEKNMPVTCMNPNGESITLTVNDLCPYPFDSEDLK